MPRFLAALFITIICLGMGATTSYAAFPIARHSTVATIHSADNMPAPTSPAKHTAAPRRIRGKSQAWALVICCLAGIIGAHRYYLGYILEGIIQTVTLGGMGVWWLIDLIRICTGDLQPKGQMYLAHFHWM